MSLRCTLALTTCTLLLAACQPEVDPRGELFASAMIGPDGGEVAGGSVTLEIPAGALTADTDIELRRLDGVDLAPPGYTQVGGVVAIFPEDLLLRQPASLTITNSQDRAAVLFEQDGLSVIAEGDTAHINEFSRTAPMVAQAELEPRVTLTMPPTIGRTPSDPGMAFQDLLHMEVAVADTPELAVVLSIYDTEQAYGRPLNGTGSGDCGFRLVNVVGGSLTGDCAEGSLTALIRVSGSLVSFDIESFLAGELPTPVVVGAVVGGDELAYQLGFFGFQTTAG
jgi:hypothetical protein